MRFMSWRSAVALGLGVLLVSVLAVACGGGKEGNQTQTPTRTAAGTATPAATGTAVSSAEGPLVMEVTTDKTAYQRGEPVAMRLTMRPNPIAVLFFRNSQRYNFMVVSGGQIVWSWVMHQVLVPETGSEVLALGDEVVYEEVWDQLDNEGNQVPPGTYMVIGQTAACDQNYENCSVEPVSTTIDIGGG
jgi:hypothetical protein